MFLLTEVIVLGGHWLPTGCSFNHFSASEPWLDLLLALLLASMDDVNTEVFLIPHPNP